MRNIRERASCFCRMLSKKGLLKNLLAQSQNRLDLEEIKKGDVLLLCELSRLGRSMLEVIEIISIAERNLELYCERSLATEPLHPE